VAQRESLGIEEFNRYLREMTSLAKVEPEILVMWVGGSAASGRLDDCSDLDLWVCCSDDTDVPGRTLTSMTANHRVIAQFSLPHAKQFMGGAVLWIKFSDWPPNSYLDLHILRRQNLFDGRLRQVQHMIKEVPTRAVLHDPEHLLDKVRYPDLSGRERKAQTSRLINEFYFQLLRTVKYNRRGEFAMEYECFVRMLELLVGAWKLTSIDRLDFEPRWRKDKEGTRKRRIQTEILKNLYVRPRSAKRMLVRNFREAVRERAGKREERLLCVIEDVLKNENG
jgi:hypothetical protein